MEGEKIKKTADIKAYRKLYREQNKEKTRQLMKEYMTSQETNPIIVCEICGSSYRKYYKTRHILKSCHILSPSKEEKEEKKRKQDELKQIKEEKKRKQEELKLMKQLKKKKKIEAVEQPNEQKEE